MMMQIFSVGSNAITISTYHCIAVVGYNKIIEIKCKEIHIGTSYYVEKLIKDFLLFA